jgi:hypothetical protein
MPFTFVHPAAILPLRHLPSRWVSLTGLAAGSMAPDFEKFALLRLSNAYSHTWWSLLYFTLPVGLMLTFLFHLVVRDPLLCNLPAVFRKRLARFSSFNWPRHFRHYYLAVIFSILLGGVTHLLWDECTHDRSRAGLAIPHLSDQYDLGSIRIGLWLILNLGTTILSGCYLLYVVLRLPIIPEPSPCALAGMPLPYWPTMLGVAVLLMGLKYFLGPPSQSSWDVMISCLSIMLLSLLLTSFLLKGSARSNLSKS